MVAQAPADPARQVSAAPLPLAFLGRTSTAIAQDPVSSMRRQARSAQEKAPAGSFIAAWFWDIESGGMDLEQRGHGSAHERFDVGIPRGGGIADLLAEAGGPNPRFAAAAGITDLAAYLHDHATTGDLSRHPGVGPGAVG